MSNNLETLIKDFTDRFASIEGNLSQEKIAEMVRSEFAALKDDTEFVRKMRFGGESDEGLIGTKFARYGLNHADIEFLYDVQASLKGQRNNDNGFYPGPSEELEQTFRNVSDALYMDAEEVRRIDKQAIDNLFARVPKARVDAARHMRAYDNAIRAMDTAESGYGSQLIGAQYVGDLWDAARAESRVFGLIDQFEMSAPVAYLPVEADLPALSLVGESVANNASNYGTTKTGSNRVQVDAKKFLIQQMYSGEMEEDSIIPFIPFLRRQAAISLAHYSDALVLNGDTTNAATGNINSDDEDPADTLYFLGFDGLRHVGLVDNTGNSDNVGAAIDLETLRDLRGLMIDRANLQDWGHPTQPNDLIYVADTVTADRIATLDDIIAAKIHNGGANLLNGEVARILGHPVISSMAMPLTEADGKVSFDTPANNQLGQVVAFNRRGFKVGFRRRVKFETERLVRTDQTVLSWSLRAGFGRYSATGAASGIEAAAVAYNITFS